jgi:hypothetical protein
MITLASGSPSIGAPAMFINVGGGSMGKLVAASDSSPVRGFAAGWAAHAAQQVIVKIRIQLSLPVMANVSLVVEKMIENIRKSRFQRLNSLWTSEV